LFLCREDEHYSAALEAAQLPVDLTSLPAGDETEIGAMLGQKIQEVHGSARVRQAAYGGYHKWG